jgi:hypothetical protein
VPAPAPLAAAPLPDSGSASGELVAGFPASVIGPTADSDVLSSSIATEGDTMQVTLVARTDTSTDDIRTHYAQHWAGLGLAPSDSEGAGSAYADAYTSLSLAFSPDSGTGTVYMIHAVFRTN